MNPMLSSFIEQRIEKNGLIIYSKQIDFFTNTKLKRTQLYPFGSYVQKQYDTHSQTRSKYYSFYLYYKAESEQKAIDQFKLQIDFPYQIVKEAVTKEHLLLLYNMIEFEDKFKTRNADELQNLLNQLMKFDASQKTLEEFLLFTYYRGVLNFYLKKYNESNEQFMTVIIDINEEVGNDIEKYPFIHYLVLKNNLFMWRISQIILNQKKQKGYYDFDELITLSKDMFAQFKKISPVHAIKMGLILFDLYNEKKDYGNGYQILSESYQLIKKKAFCGSAIENSPELFLQLISKLAYLSVFLLKDNTVKLAKKLQKNYSLLGSFLKSLPQLQMSQYAFCVFCLNLITQRKDTQLLSISASAPTSSMSNEYKSLLNQQDANFEVFLVNLFSIQGLDQIAMRVFTEKLDIYITTLQTNKLVLSKDLIPCYFFVFNWISGLTKSIAIESKEPKLKNINLIRTFSDCILNYTKAFVTDIDLNQLFQLSYVRVLLIKIFFCRCSAEIYENKLSRLKELLSDFDKNKKLFVNDDQSVLNEYAIIIKLKGDLEFKQDNYMKAANYYQDALQYMKNHKLMPLIYYNLGVCFYCLRDLKKSKNNLNKSLSAFQRLEKSSPMEAQKKIDKIEKILKKL